MIYEVRADQPGFKSVTLERGFNVVLAERTKESSTKDSRNGLGKSTLIDIIHFCLGSSPRPSDPLRRDALENWTFELDLDLREKMVAVRRNTASSNKVFLQGDFSDWPIQPRVDRDTNQHFLSSKEWSRLLGWAMFDLSPDPPEEKYNPTFRSLISYFVRRDQGAFLSPFSQYPNQKEWDKQVHTALLLGLNWEHAKRWQLLKDREGELRQLQQALRTGVASEFLGSIGSLESVRVRLEREVRREGEELAKFRVHEQYQQIEEEANQLTFQIRDLTNANVADHGMLSLYEESIMQETPPDDSAVAEIFAEVGVVLADRVVKRLQEVQEFHRQVVANRRDFLEGEIGRLRIALAGREARISALSDRRSDLMAVLQTHGALEGYNRLQQLHGAKVAELEDLDRRIALGQRLEREASAVRIERERLRLDARADLEDRRTDWEESIAYFNANSEALYESPGELIIDLRDAGFRFDVQIERSGSHGIDHMKVFCYDLMLAQTWAAKPVSPGVLIHDSIIFDGVDERQRAKALELAAQESSLHGFQYLCCLNSDMVPYHEFAPAFDFQSSICLTLTDVTEEGGLLGFRF